jgi:hypothetical protein
MADDYTLRSTRSNEAIRRAAPTDVPSDPLAELARLIGQTDPFVETGRGSAHTAPPRDPIPPEPAFRDPPVGDWRRYIERPNYEAMNDEPARPVEPRLPEPDEFAAAARIAPQVDPYRMASPQPHADDHDYQHAYSDGRMQHAAFHEHAGGHHPTHAEEAYDDPPRRARSSSLLTAVILIGCAMLGTAGAYGYRSYTAGSGSGPTPIIVADAAPSKVVPTADPKSGRSQERVPGGGERLVSREEQPVTLEQPGGGASPPRVVFPPLVPAQPSAPPVADNAPPATNSTPPASSPSEPRRIRTLTIRSDGSDSSARPMTAPSAPPPPQRTATVEPKQSPPAARPLTPPAAPRANASAARPSSPDGPLSLDPGASTTEPARTAPQRQAQERPLTPPAPRVGVAAVPASGGSGGYLVQVSSQRSEADAQASFRSLQGKYAPLQSRQAIIRRAELGSKGTYYRAFVGPFGSAGEADQFCSSLKSAGGQCLIVRN